MMRTRVLEGDFLWHVWVIYTQLRLAHSLAHVLLRNWGRRSLAGTRWRGRRRDLRSFNPLVAVAG